MDRHHVSPARAALIALGITITGVAGCGEPTDPALGAAAPVPSSAEAPATELRPARSYRNVLLSELPRDPQTRAETIEAWAEDPELPAELRAASLRRAEPEQALELALALSVHELGDAILGPNLVATLARSDDPRAAAALARLPDRYRALARSLVALEAR